MAQGCLLHMAEGLVLHMADLCCTWLLDLHMAQGFSTLLGTFSSGEAFACSQRLKAIWFLALF